MNSDRQAQQTAGEKDVVKFSADIMRQALGAGLLDELNLDLVPIRLGEGNRWPERLGPQPLALKIERGVEGYGVTHRRYAVVRQ
jgi:dihydrofolate reductase